MLINRIRADWQKQEQSCDTATALQIWKYNLHLDKHNEAMSIEVVLGTLFIFQSIIGFFPFERWPYTFVWVLSFVINLATIPRQST